MKRPLILLFSSLLLQSVWSQEDVFKPDESASPDGQFYASVVSILPTDPQNENPYRVAVRESATGKIIGSVVSDIEMTDPNSLRETRVIWTETGSFVVFLMPSDRRTRVSKVFYIDFKHRRALPVRIQDYFQNMLGRINRVEAPEFYFESVSPLKGNLILIEVSSGSRDPKYSLQAEATIELIGDPHSEPFGRLTSVKIK